eukprot:365323-Chlamydomonas_euryale.AAC.10
MLGVPAGSPLPVAVAICNGDLNLLQRYNGDMKGEALKRFITEFEGGRRCRCARAGKVGMGSRKGKAKDKEDSRMEQALACLFDADGCA